MALVSERQVNERGCSQAIDHGVGGAVVASGGFEPAEIAGCFVRLAAEGMDPRLCLSHLGEGGLVVVEGFGERVRKGECLVEPALVYEWRERGSGCACDHRGQSAGGGICDATVGVLRVLLVVRCMTTAGCPGCCAGSRPRGLVRLGWQARSPRACRPCRLRRRARRERCRDSPMPSLGRSTPSWSASASARSAQAIAWALRPLSTSLAATSVSASTSAGLGGSGSKSASACAGNSGARGSARCLSTIPSWFMACAWAWRSPHACRAGIASSSACLASRRREAWKAASA